MGQDSCVFGRHEGGWATVCSKGVRVSHTIGDLGRTAPRCSQSAVPDCWPPCLSVMSYHHGCMSCLIMVLTCRMLPASWRLCDVVSILDTSLVCRAALSVLYLPPETQVHHDSHS